MNAKERGDLAAGYFDSGMNCAQSVYCAFAEDFGVDKETAAKLASGLGGGVGRLREVCGAVSAAALVLGHRFGPDKAKVYPEVQRFAEEFKREFGSIVCRELLEGTGATTGGAPEPRTSEYKRVRPCANFVRFVAEHL